VIGLPAKVLNIIDEYAEIKRRYDQHPDPAVQPVGACETTPRATDREQHATPDNPTANRPFLALEDLPPLAGVKLVRPRRCAAAGAPA
jgi:hypothetical protein